MLEKVIIISKRKESMFGTYKDVLQTIFSLKVFCFENFFRILMMIIAWLTNEVNFIWLGLINIPTPYTPIPLPNKFHFVAHVRYAFNYAQSINYSEALINASVIHQSHLFFNNVVPYDWRQKKNVVPYDLLLPAN